LPVFNGEKYLVSALKRLGEQEFEDYELIICDNDSTDKTREICLSFAERDKRIRYYLNERNVGLAANHNRTFELARGEYFKWVAHDDDYPRAMLRRFVDVLDQSSKAVGLVYSHCEYIDESGNVTGMNSDGVALNHRSPRKRLAQVIRHVHMFNSVYGLVRADVLRKTRRHGSFPYADYVLLAELAMLTTFVEIPEPLLRIRRHPGRTFTANKTVEELRDVFTPGEQASFPRLSLEAGMKYELIRGAWQVPPSLSEKLSCTAIALVKPQWEAFRAYGGRQKRKVLALFSSSVPAFRAGDWVEVRSKEEILRTLDKNGQLDGMPFMPEMFELCGKLIYVDKRAHKTCDTVRDYAGRRLKHTVHLAGVRCSGRQHGGCEASCSIFWKTAWLTSTDHKGLMAANTVAKGSRPNHLSQCTEEDVQSATQRVGEGRDIAYVCQATQLLTATEPLPWWAFRQYLEDYTSGNVGLIRMLKTFAFKTYCHGLVNLGIGIGPALTRLYDLVQRLRSGTPYPHKTGKIPVGTRTPETNLELQPGEWVRVKSYDAIRETCDAHNKNRGMSFDREMVPYCGGTYQVLKRVGKIIDEKTGRMLYLKNPSVILDTVVCQARYSDCRLFCPRNAYAYWREIWLERINDGRDSVGRMERNTRVRSQSIAPIQPDGESVETA
jgi:glycosyltransferase involved in cell wall biosynthesis